MSGPAPAVAAVRVAVRAALADLPAGALVLVACSGGADSLALAAATSFVAARRGLRAGAVVVDHGWRASSAADAERARRGLCGPGAGAGARRSGERRAGGVGRRRRRPRGRRPTSPRTQPSSAVAGEEGADAVLLGHTLDDQAETVLLGLARGSGAALAGRDAGPARALPPPAARPAAGPDPRGVLRAGAGPGADDPANADPRYTRARVRSALAVLEDALGPGLPAALARTAALLAEDAAALELAAADVLAAAGAQPGRGRVSSRARCSRRPRTPSAVGPCSPRRGPRGPPRGRCPGGTRWRSTRSSRAGAARGRCICRAGSWPAEDLEVGVGRCGSPPGDRAP